jgi:hypothetical protein
MSNKSKIKEIENQISELYTKIAYLTDEDSSAAAKEFLFQFAKKGEVYVHGGAFCLRMSEELEKKLNPKALYHGTIALSPEISCACDDGVYRLFTGMAVPFEDINETHILNWLKSIGFDIKSIDVSQMDREILDAKNDWLRLKNDKKDMVSLISKISSQ